jgi:transcriptional regulator with XRE-family HTH domain
MRKNPIGPVGVSVAANVQRLREDQNLTLAKFSRKLATTGRRIPALGLARIERLDRRVDADDLAALALVLGVSPTVLLSPHRERTNS